MKQLVAETGEQLITHTGKIAESIITGKELLGDIKPMTEGEMAQRQVEDERKKQKEAAELKSQMGNGRNVEGEIEKIVEEKKKKEEEEERAFLENLKRQREAEEMEMQEPVFLDHKKGGNPRKKNKPTDDSMSQTTEFSKKPD